ncbi:MAG: TonB-dependent receptor plug domain-containing protein, partial [bacterium]
MLKKLSLSLAVFALLLSASAASAVDEGGSPAAPSEYIESISAPTAEGQGAIGESDALGAEADAVAAGDVPAFVSAERQHRVEEIVVSARKRSELLEDTPVSVTALSATRLREAGVNRIDDIQELVPNLSFQTSSTGTEALAYIRGVGLPRSLTSFDPGVGIYVDGVFLPRAQGSLLDVVDIAQIEVLRGPQGTLFGKNTVGGAINFTTVKPGDEFEAFAFVRAGSFESVRTRAMLNVPIDIGWLEDRLAMRLAFASANSQGFVENLEQQNYQSDINSLTFLGSLRFTPHERVTFDVSGSWDRTQSHTRGRTCAWQSDESALGWIYVGFKEACERSQPYEIRTDVPTNDYQQSFGVWGTITGDVGDIGPFTDLTLKSITAWRKQTNDHWTSQDIDVTEVLVTQLLSAPGQPGFLQIQEEVQLNGRVWDDRIDFVTGF